MKKTMRFFCLMLATLILCVGLAQCGEDKPGVPSEKPEVPDVPDPDEPAVGEDGYPVGLLVKSFTDELSGGAKCLGFYAVVDFAANENLMFLPQHAAGKVPTKYFSDFAATGGGTPYVVINGGYFNSTSKSLSLLIERSSVKSIALQSDHIWATNTQFFPVRAALGRMGDGSFEAAWVYCAADDANRPYAFTSALGNNEKTKTFMSEAPTSKTAGGRYWEPRYAIGGGPMLVCDGKNVAEENYWKEIFEVGGGAGMARHPRTAIGVTADGKMVLCVCDGRGKRGSAGFTMPEMADKLISLGCVIAINLDGGGSSAFVGREGKVLNLPSDSASAEAIKERSVPTVVIIAEK